MAGKLGSGSHLRSILRIVTPFEDPPVIFPSNKTGLDGRYLMGVFMAFLVVFGILWTVVGVSLFRHYGSKA
jgi:hypothetical protein